MGSDLYMNPPHIPPLELWRQVQNVQRDLSDAIKEVADLKKIVREKDAEIKTLMDALRLMKAGS